MVEKKEIVPQPHNNIVFSPKKDNGHDTIPNEDSKNNPQNIIIPSENKKEESSDKDLTPKLHDPVGLFKRVRTFDHFCDTMDIPAENNSPVMLPLSPTMAQTNRKESATSFTRITLVKRSSCYVKHPNAP